MNKAIKELSLSISKILYFLLPFPVALLSLSLMSMYMRYYDIGVNMSANNGFLVFFLAPALLVILYVTAATSLYLANRLFNFQWLGILLGSALMLVVGIGSFLIEVRSVLDYPTEKPKNMVGFLQYYLTAIGRGN
jgi:hypothetical protein